MGVGVWRDVAVGEGVRVGVRVGDAVWVAVAVEGKGVEVRDAVGINDGDGDGVEVGEAVGGEVVISVVASA